MFPTTSDIINKDLEKRSNKNKIAVLDKGLKLEDFDFYDEKIIEKFAPMPIRGNS